MKKEIPLAITGLSGLMVIVGEYLRFAQNLGWLTTFNTWFQVATTVAFPIGLVSLTLVHGHNIQRKRADWGLSILMLAATYVYLAFDLVSGPANGTVMSWVYTAYISPVAATLYAMTSFLITSATFRTFRCRNREATLLVVAALFIVVAQSPLAGLISHYWGATATWIINYPSNAAFRAITLGAYLGAFATAIRILLGIERAHLGSLAK